MDVGLTQSIVNTATAMASQKTSDAVNITVLKKAMDIQKSSAAQLLEALPQPQPQPQLATSGFLGTQVNTYA
ncbi:YjfB family protein [Paracidovorax cattleyae]|uniref:YjfB family protein n=1 Tax=Paracidovorax cattleyae TaxID=80868 RepID=UPI0018AF6C75|nr:YjfB family protein [Paracidovorax cattleyae]MBF9267104.1 YjfB family protein [Paracidovorax cattleyae]